MEYRFSKEGQGIADDVISKHHPHLLGVKVLVVFMDKTPKSGDKDVWGRAKKITGLPAFLAGHGDRAQYSDQPADFFVVELSEEIWQSLTPKQKRALIDHECSHMDIGFDEETGAVKLKIVGHDVTEFSAILERHGLWTEPLEEFVREGAEQLSFSDLPQKPEEPTLEDSEALDELHATVSHNGHTAPLNSEEGREVIGEAVENARRTARGLEVVK